MNPDTSSPNCYKCEYRRQVPGSAHSRCVHPRIESNVDNVFAVLLSTSIGKAVNALNIKAVRHGIIKGWFMWPVDFDPVWLVSCNGFVKKE